MKIKICGLTRPQDIMAMNEYQPDYAGFVINFPKSRRSVTPQRVYELTEQLLPSISVVVILSYRISPQKSNKCLYLFVRYIQFCDSVHISRNYEQKTQENPGVSLTVLLQFQQDFSEVKEFSCPTVENIIQ